MPRLRDVPTLEELSVSHIAENIDFFCSEYYGRWRNVYRFKRRIRDKSNPTLGYFAQKNHVVLKLIFLKLLSLEALRMPHIRIFILECLKRFRFTCSKEITIKSTIEFLSKRCKGLEVLKLRREIEENEFESRISQKTLAFAFNTWKNLKVLHLENCDIRDESVAYIATHCKGLSSLGLYNTKVSDVGLYSLSKGDYYYLLKPGVVQPSVLKDSLEFLNVERTSITVECLRQVLEDLNLKCILSSILFEALIQIATNTVGAAKPIDQVPTFPFAEAKQVFSCRDEIDIPEDTIKILFKMIPNVNCLTIHNVPQTFLTRLPVNELNITKLELQSFAQLLDFDVIHPFLRAKGGFLTTLTLRQFVHVDINYIGSECPNISELSLFYNDVLNGYIDPEYFKKLSYLNFEVNEVRHLGIDNMRTLFSLGTLETLILETQHFITDVSFSMVIRSNIFPNLRTLTFENCSQISEDTIKRILDLPNPLSRLELIDCLRLDYATFVSIISYIKQNNLNVGILWQYYGPKSKFRI